jgi:tetrahydromethanopterin S-methyltransferase subunit G
VAWKAIGNIAALVGVLVAMVMMFNQVDGRLDRVHERMDRMQAETNPRFDAVDERFDKMFDRMDRTQAETNARFDAVLEAIMSFDRRASRIERRLDAQSAGAAE